MYLKNKHFEDMLPGHATIERISSKAVRFEYKTTLPGKGYTRDNETYGIIYVDTVVVEVVRNIDREKDLSIRCDHGIQIKLNTDGRKTETTKRHMNTILKDFGCRVYQKNNTRYIENGHGETAEYFDGIVL